MDKTQFIEHLHQARLEGQTLENASQRPLYLLSCDDNRLNYQRGRAVISISCNQLFKTWHQFRGRHICDQQLKTWKPAVFDSNAFPRAGHNSNCDLFVLLMYQLGLAENLTRTGRYYQADLRLHPAPLPRSAD